MTLKLLIFFVLVFYSFSHANSRPPYDGTIFFFKDAINSNDPTAFQKIVFIGQDNGVQDKTLRGRTILYISKKLLTFFNNGGNYRNKKINKLIKMVFFID